MSENINRVFISGNLTRDPELRQTANGSSVLNFGVAVNDRRRNPQTGEYEEHANFINCVMWGARAEGVARYLSKGAKVSIEGKLRYRSWETDGVKRNTIEVAVDTLEFLSRNQDQQTSGGQTANQAQSYAAPVAAAPNQATPAPAQTQAPAQTTPPAVDVYDEDIPF